MKRIFSILFALTLCLATAYAEQVEPTSAKADHATLWETANAAYNGGDYAKALSSYEAIAVSPCLK